MIGQIVDRVNSFGWPLPTPVHILDWGDLAEIEGAIGN